MDQGPALVETAPNSNRNSPANPNMISQEVVNVISKQVWDTRTDLWLPRDIIDHSPTVSASNANVFDLGINHFYATVVHLDTGETVTKYKKLASDPNNLR